MFVADMEIAAEFAVVRNDPASAEKGDESICDTNSRNVILFEVR